MHCTRILVHANFADGDKRSSVSKRIRAEITLPYLPSRACRAETRSHFHFSIAHPHRAALMLLLSERVDDNAKKPKRSIQNFFFFSFRFDRLL